MRLLASTPQPSYPPTYLSASLADVVGCGQLVDTYSCITSGGGCDPNDANLQWVVTPVTQSSTAALVRISTALPSGGCVSASPTGALQLFPCGSPPQNWTQEWLTSGLTPGAKPATLALADVTTTCLGLRAPPPLVYGRVCARLVSQSWVGTRYIPSGYCVDAGGDGVWRLWVGPTRGVVASGPLPPGFDGSHEHTLSLRVVGFNVTAALDSVPLLMQPWVDADHSFPAGMVGIGSGYHEASWGAFSVQPAL